MRPAHRAARTERGGTRDQRAGSALMSFYGNLFNIPRPLVLHPNEIDAMYWQMYNNGQFYIGQFGSHPITINEWRRRELEKAGDGVDQAHA